MKSHSHHDKAEKPSPGIVLNAHAETNPDELARLVAIYDSQHNLSFTSGKRDKIYFKGEPQIIMEVKADGVMPLWLVKEMSKLHIYPQQFSKIGKIYACIRKEQHV